MKMFEEPEYVESLLKFCADVCKAMSDYYIDAGCDVIALVDPMTSQIGPDQFEKFVKGPCSEVFSHIKNKGALSSFFVCGNAEQNIEVMCECKPDNVSIDENISLEYVKIICSRHRISYGGNLQLTVVLLLGTPDDAKKNTFECMKAGGDTGFILAPGCDLLYATPLENLQAVASLVHDSYQQQIAETLLVNSIDEILPELPDYQNERQVLVDIITLDSLSCAPCQYMLDAVKKASERFGNNVVWKEHSIKNIDGIKMMKTLKVSNLPTICIDGNIEYISRIPPVEDIAATIQKYFDRKY